MTHRPHRRLTQTVTAVTAGACAMLAASCSTEGGSSLSNSSHQSDTSGSDMSANNTAAPGTVTRHTTTVDNRDRTWTTYTPLHDQPDPRPMPIVLVVHGTGDTGDGIRSGIGLDLERLADEHGFVIAYADGYANNWNECRIAGDWPAKVENVDDVGFLRDIVDRLGSDLGDDTVDTSTVFGLGFSSGGHMAQRLAFEAPDLVSGIASVNANVATDGNMDCDDTGEPVPALFMQGREDPWNPFDGGEVIVGEGMFAESRGDVHSAVDSAQWFADRNGAEGPDDTSRDGDAEITDWPGEHPVRLIAVDHSGHSFPTTTGRWGNDNGARYDGPGAVWEFFAAL